MSSESEYWEGIPVELRLLCNLESEYNDVPHQLVTPVMHYLYEHTRNYISSESGTKREDLLHWIEAGFDKCLFPLKIHCEDWERNGRYVCEILGSAEKMLLDEDSDIFMESTVRPEAEGREAFLNRFSQKLNAYYCIHYSTCCQHEEMQDRMEMLFEDTKRNVINLLNYKDKSADWITGEFKTDKAYEPLIFLCYEKAPDYPSVETLTYIYERYAVFIDGLFDTLPEDGCKVCLSIQSSVEWRLKTLCSTARLYCRMGMLQPGHSVEYWEEKIDMYKQLEDESRLRLEKRGNN